MPNLQNNIYYNGLLDVDFTKPLSFTFDGKQYLGYQGDSIASALYRAGVRIFSRSFKYHRPRGLMTLDSSSPNDLVKVNGIPNIHASTTLLKPDMKVRAQNAWPTVKYDLLGIFNILSPLLPAGFYYKTFIRPRAFWPFYERVLRHVAGLGSIDPNPDNFKESHYDQSYAHTEVTVVGGGPSGMSAALAAADLGAQVTLIEKELHLGGHLRISNFDLSTVEWDFLQFPELKNILSSLDLVNHLKDRVVSHPRITLLISSTAFGWYQDNFIGVSQKDGLIKVRTDQLIVATGRIEQPLVFENNDLPGIFLGGGIQRLMHQYGIKPGSQAIIVTTNDQGWMVARDLLDYDVEVAMISDSRREIIESSITQQVRSAGVPAQFGMFIEKALGKNRVRGAVLAPVDGRGTSVKVNCDLISVSGGYSANNALLYQSGSKIEYDPNCDDFVPLSYPNGVRGTGHAVGTQGLEAILLESRAAGMLAASQVGYRSDERALHLLLDKVKQLKVRTYSNHKAEPNGQIPTQGDKSFVCFCEDVTSTDVCQAVAEGFEDIQTLKRYSTISMGPSQGKICAKNTIKLASSLTGRRIAETGTTTSRPPFMPVKLGVLAGKGLNPIRLTPVHPFHAKMDAKMLNAGQWIRPEHYGHPDSEVHAVRNSVGVIDVSTLGKIDVRGPDAIEFLERIYTGRIADLRVNHLRYGLMCTEEGIILDDGVICCLAEDHFYLTTTSGGAQSVFEWLTWWATAWGSQVHISDQTACFAAVNVAGPNARKVLSKISDIDVSNQAFSYMQMRQAEVSGISARMMRIGFVGELGYEIHYPAEYGQHIWGLILQAGAEFGITPFAVEAQRVLRLEKGHMIVGQDTDGLTDPFSAGMSWAVKLDKSDFIGGPSLIMKQENPSNKKLVGFEIPGSRHAAGEGEQFIDKGRLIGRVTSARYSPSLQKSIGLGWINTDYADVGTLLTLRTNGKLTQAAVVRTPFYDLEGKQLRL